MAYQSNEITQLMAQKEALDKQLAAAQEMETRHVLREIVQKMREYNISLNELMGRKPAAPMVHDSEARTEPVAKYRDPVSGSTWCGRGRAPHWIVGKDREAFVVDQRIAAQADLFGRRAVKPFSARVLRPSTNGSSNIVA
jgi:DNA-binding protein H-NS